MTEISAAVTRSAGNLIEPRALPVNATESLPSG